MDNCFVLGLFALALGVFFLLSSLTKIGRDFDRAYLKGLPNSMRWRSLERWRNPMASVAGAMMVLGGILILARAVYFWWTGRPCGL